MANQNRSTSPSGDAVSDKDINRETDSPLRRKLRSKSPNKRKSRSTSSASCDGSTLTSHSSSSIHSSPKSTRGGRRIRSKSDVSLPSGSSQLAHLNSSSHSADSSLLDSPTSKSKHSRSKRGGSKRSGSRRALMSEDGKNSSNRDSTSRSKSPSGKRISRRSLDVGQNENDVDIATSPERNRSKRSSSRRALLSDVVKSKSIRDSETRSKSPSGKRSSRRSTNVDNEEDEGNSVASPGSQTMTSSGSKHGGSSRQALMSDVRKRTSTRDSTRSKSPSGKRSSRSSRSSRALGVEDTEEEPAMASPHDTQMTSDTNTISSSLNSHDDDSSRSRGSCNNYNNVMGSSKHNRSSHNKELHNNDEGTESGFCVVSSQNLTATHPFTNFRRSSLDHNHRYHPATEPGAPAGSFSDDEGAAALSPRRVGKKKPENRRGSMNMIYAKPTKDLDEKEQLAELAAHVSNSDLNFDVGMLLSDSHDDGGGHDAEEEVRKRGRRPMGVRSSSPTRVRSMSPSKAQPIPRQDGNGEQHSGGGERFNKAKLKIQMMHLDQRNKERTARLEMAKERIQRSQEEEEVRRQQEANRELTTEERRQLAYQWYTRCGFPHIGEFKKRVRLMRGACEITERDVDLLPWMDGGKRVNAKKMFTMT